MRVVPVDVSQFLAAVAMSQAEPVLDLTTRQQRKNRDGVVLFSVQVAVTGPDGTASVEAVRVAGTAPQVRPGQFVELVGLTARPWAVGERAGVSFHAVEVRPARPGPVQLGPSVSPVK